jgi:hypothetical protein
LIKPPGISSFFFFAEGGFRSAVMLRLGGVAGFLAEWPLFIVTPLLVESSRLFAAWLSS